MPASLFRHGKISTCRGRYSRKKGALLRLFGQSRPARNKSVFCSRIESPREKKRLPSPYRKHRQPSKSGIKIFLKLPDGLQNMIGNLLAVGTDDVVYLIIAVRTNTPRRQIEGAHLIFLLNNNENSVSAGPHCFVKYARRTISIISAIKQNCQCEKT